MVKRRKLVGRFVEVKWWDAKSEATWLRYRGKKWEEMAASPCTTRGWVVKETARAISLAGTISHDGGKWDFSEVITIPRAWATVKIVDKKRITFDE